ncbi:hypothetical protein BC941DRAFT_499744 [Chlamydoabsidia padenii]|nr:hypothetical protein BC941DRAFT_499744 [Chlamydoabsidia padenii]
MTDVTNTAVFLPPQTGQIKKKPGRKPNPVSPAARKAQNRAAQRAFRERKERHMKALEVDTQRLLQERDKFMKKNQQLSKENDTLKWENWYLKGVVMSLQLVCFKSKLHVPKHTPHLEDEDLQQMTKSHPTAVASYLELTHRCLSPAASNNTNNNINHHYSDNKSSKMDLSTQGTTTYDDKEENPRSDTASPFSVNHTTFDSATTLMTTHSTDNDTNMEDVQPVMLMPDVMNNNLVAIQALRLRLRLESAIIREKSSPHTITPTELQMAVPHDARIDLIPTPQMRDRMILFRDFFDLETCLQLLASESQFLGGDPSIPANWKVPDSFYEKYWFLTTQYSEHKPSYSWHDRSKPDSHSSFNDNDHKQQHSSDLMWQPTHEYTSQQAPQMEQSILDVLYSNYDPQLLSVMNLPLLNGQNDRFDQQQHPEQGHMQEDQQTYQSWNQEYTLATERHHTPR